MKRYIRSASNLDRTFIPPYDEDQNETTIRNAIDAMTYSAYDNYYNDPDATYDLILQVIVDHLEAPDLYALKEGVDFTKHDVAEEMAKYDWDYINENMSVDRWIRKSGLYASTSVQAGIGTGKRSVWYIGQFPDRNRVKFDGYKTYGFDSEEEAQSAIDELYKIDYYVENYPGLKPMHKFEYSVWHD